MTLGTFSRGTFFCFFKILEFGLFMALFGLFWPWFLKAVPFLFGLSKSLAFLHEQAHGVPLGAPFWIFQKYAFLRPWRPSGTCPFFQIAGFCTFFSKICTKCCAVFFWLALGLRYGTWACANVSQGGLLWNFLKILISKKTARGLGQGGYPIFFTHYDCIAL